MAVRCFQESFLPYICKFLLEDLAKQSRENPLTSNHYAI